MRTTALHVRLLMRVALVTVYSHPGCTLKDVAGGYGTVFEVGDSWRARLLEAAKARLADLPPLVLGYLSAQLRAAGHAVSLVEVRDGVAPEVDAAIVLSSIVDCEAERALLERLRERGVRSLVIGAHATARPQRYADVADVVVRGEPENLGAALLDLADGVAEAGSVSDLDALPFPDWSPFPTDRYRYAFLSRGITLPVSSARGCPYACGYCPWRVTAAFRERDPARVAAEVAHLRDRYGATGVSFRDPLFNLDPDRVRAIANALMPLGMRFSGEMRADRLDEGLLVLLWRAGLRSLEIGVESVDRGLLGAHKRKPPELAQIERVVKVAQRLGVRVICNYLLGLPEDDERTMRATVDWAKRLDSFAVQFTVATPYPGTTLEAKAAPLPPEALTGFRPSVPHPTMSGDAIAALREEAYVSYHFRPRYMWRFARHAAAALWD
ncbi:MAG: radical SAM protein [Sandaracinaceae bacterium]